MTSVDKDVQKSEALYTSGGNIKMVQLPWKTIWGFFKKLETQLSYDPAISLPAIYPKDLKTVSRSAIHTGAFIATLFTTAKFGSNP